MENEHPITGKLRLLASKYPRSGDEAQLPDIVESACKNLGIRVHSQSRVRRACDWVRARTGPAKSSEPNVLLYERSLFDLDQIAYALLGLTSSRQRSAAVRLVQELSRGPAEMWRERAHCKSRSSQFELYLLGILARGGLSPEVDEPDIVCRSKGVSLGIACKRVRSQAKINERMYDAQKQIKIAKLPGIIVLDLSTCLGFHYGIAPSIDTRRTLSWVEDFGHHFETEILPRIKTSLDLRYVYGIAYFIHIVILDTRDGVVHDRYPLAATGIWPTMDDADIRKPVFDEFARAVREGEGMLSRKPPPIPLWAKHMSGTQWENFLHLQRLEMEDKMLESPRRFNRE